MFQVGLPVGQRYPREAGCLRACEEVAAYRDGLAMAVEFFTSVETTPFELTCPPREAASNMWSLPCSGIESWTFAEASARWSPRSRPTAHSTWQHLVGCSTINWPAVRRRCW